MSLSQNLHTISTVGLDDTFLQLYQRVNDTISVVNQIRIYDVQGTGGIVHRRDVVTNPIAREVLSINLASTGANLGYGLSIIALDSPTISEAEGATYALRFDPNNAEAAPLFLSSGVTAYVNESDYILIAATGSRGDDNFRPLKVFAKDSLPYGICGDHRFSGKIYFDGSEVVFNSSEVHFDDRLLFLSSAGTTDSPSLQSGLLNNVSLAGGSGSGFVIKGASGDKFFAYQNSEGTSVGYYAFRLSENLQLDGSFVAPDGSFVFVGVSGSAPSISLRTKGQDSLSTPLGWKIYQSVTGGSIGTLKIKREGITDFDSLELFANSEVKIGAIHDGSSGSSERSGSFTTRAAKFSVPGTNNTGVLHYGWQNRDVVELAATADSGLFAEPTSTFKPGTVLSLDSNGKYIRARWDADPSNGYKEAEVVGIIESVTSNDYLLQIPVTGGTPYSTSIFSKGENVSIVGNGYTVRGYVYDDSLPINGLSGIRVFVDSFPTGITTGSFTAGSGTIFVGGATLRGTADEDAIGICGSIGITVSPVNYAVIVRQGVFDIPVQGSGATGYDQIYTLGLTPGYLFYLGGTMNGNDANCYGGVTISSGNLFNPIEFYNAGANVAKPLFIYLGTIEGKKAGLFQPYQGLGLTYSITSADTQPIYYDTDTGEIDNPELLGEVGGNRNKILNCGIDLWSRLDTFGLTYFGAEGQPIKGVTFGDTPITEYPHGSTYSSDSPFNLVSGYIADGFFFDTFNRNRTMRVERQQLTPNLILNSLPQRPEYELKFTQSSGSGKCRLYAVVPDHKTLSKHDMNFSFYAKSDTAGTMGVTTGIAFVWSNGSTYAVTESSHVFISDGSGTSGGNYYSVNIGSTYDRYQFAFSSESLSYPGATGIGDSFVAPFIEFGSLSEGESFFVTGFQLSKGMKVKPFSKRSYAEEKSECDRYFQNIVLAHGGYYPISTGSSGPKLFTGTNINTTMAELPSIKAAIDITKQGIQGACGSTDPYSRKKNHISVFRETDPTSVTYHRYFETLYTLDASGFSGAVNNKLTGLI